MNILEIEGFMQGQNLKFIGEQLNEEDMDLELPQIDTAQEAPVEESHVTVEDNDNPPITTVASPSLPMTPVTTTLPKILGTTRKIITHKPILRIVPPRCRKSPPLPRTCCPMATLGDEPLLEARPPASVPTLAPERAPPEPTPERPAPEQDVPSTPTPEQGPKEQRYYFATEHMSNRLESLEHATSVRNALHTKLLALKATHESSSNALSKTMRIIKDLQPSAPPAATPVTGKKGKPDPSPLDLNTSLDLDDFDWEIPDPFEEYEMAESRTQEDVSPSLEESLVFPDSQLQIRMDLDDDSDAGIPDFAFVSIEREFDLDLVAYIKSVKYL